jgi:hypothetical protein
MAVRSFDAFNFGLLAVAAYFTAVVDSLVLLLKLVKAYLDSYL